MTPSPAEVKPFMPCRSYRPPPPPTSGFSSPLPLSNRVQNATGPEYLAIRKTTCWPNRMVLRVLLLDKWVDRRKGYPDRIGTGNITVKLRAAVEQYVKLWEDNCSITFEFVEQRPAEIRIGFGAEDGHWSFVGRDNIDVSIVQDDERTMNLQYNDTSFPMDVRATILHEFGHALGCIHEHQSPTSPIEWNEPAVFKAFPDWDEETVRHNILNSNAANASDYHFTDFDPSSIMVYAIDASWTLNNISIVANQSISALDISLIREMYPPDTTSSNRFVTPRIKGEELPHLKNPTTVMLANCDKHSPPPRIAVGLSSLHVGAGSNVRISTAADEPERTNVIIHLDSWFNTKLQLAACTWIETPHGSCFQVGKFNTMAVRAWTDPKQKTSTKVNFATAFAAPPTVVVWLNWIDADKNHDVSIKAHASEITATGFTIHIDTGSDCILYSGGATWIAYPAGADGISSGVITTTSDKKDPNFEKNGTITFPLNTFDCKPKALIAVTSIDFAHGKDVIFDALVDKVDATTLTWRIKSSSKSTCRNIDATYLAF